MKAKYRHLVAIGMIGIVAALQGCQAPGTMDHTMDDAQITTQIKQAIVNEAMFKVNQIKVETFNGVVQLSGTVPSRVEALQVQEMAKSIKGVKEIKDNLMIK
jgi:hypothetical protein